MRYKFLRFPEGKSKAFTMSYDDGAYEDIQFSDIISPYGLKCTFNMVGDTYKKDNFTAEKMEEIYYSRGHEVAVHGAFHRAEGTQRPIDGIRDVLNCRLELEAKTGRIIRGMAYPDTGITLFANGANYENIKRYLTDLDIVYSRTLGGDNNLFRLPTDWHAWMPTAHHQNPKLMEYLDEFISIDNSEKVYGARRHPRLFYLWGHTYEFRMNNNWDLLEDICKKIANNDEIWYATNIEIYDYVTAYNSLVFSADSTLCYNPTLFKIWFDIDGKLYSINPGETLKIQ